MWYNLLIKSVKNIYNLSHTITSLSMIYISLAVWFLGESCAADSNACIYKICL